MSEAREMMEKLSKKMGPKICRDCKYITTPSILIRIFMNDLAWKYAKCSHPDAEWNKDYVSGKGEFTYCSCMREIDYHCGEEGKFWEAKS